MVSSYIVQSGLELSNPVTTSEYWDYRSTPIRLLLKRIFLVFCFWMPTAFLSCKQSPI